jgi:hypothetical protein
MSAQLNPKPACPHQLSVIQEARRVTLALTVGLPLLLLMPVLGANQLLSSQAHQVRLGKISAAWTQGGGELAGQALTKCLNDAGYNTTTSSLGAIFISKAVQQCEDGLLRGARKRKVMEEIQGVKIDGPTVAQVQQAQAQRERIDDLLMDISASLP